MDEAREPPRHLFSDYVEMVYLGCVILVGVPLNVNVFRKLSLEMSKTPRHSVKRGFVLLNINLNISDLLILLVHALGKLMWLATYEWRAGDLLCRVFNFLSMFTLYLSSNIIVCIAFDRLRTVMAANKLRQGKNQSHYTHSLVAFGWFFAVLWSLPQLYVWRTVNAFEEHPGGWVQCTDIWAINELEVEKGHASAANASWVLQEETRNVYNLSHLVMVFYGPLAMLCFCYLMIAFKIMRYSMKDPRLPSRGNGVEDCLGPSPYSVFRKRFSAISSTRSLLELNPHSSESERSSKQRHSTATYHNHSAVVKGDAESWVQLEHSSDMDAHSQRTKTVLERWVCLRGRRSSQPVGLPRHSTELFTSSPPFSPHGPESRKGRKKSSTAQDSLPGWRRQLRSKVFRTTLLIIVAHVLFWLPYNLYALMQYINEDLHLRMNDHANVFKELQFLIAIINPFLYGLGAPR